MNIRGTLCILAVLLLLIACTRQKPNAGLFIYREDDLFMRSLTEDIIEKAEGIIKLETYYSLNSQVIQNEQIETALRQGAQLLIINPVDRLGTYAIINKLRTLNIPVIFFNREPLPRDIALWDRVWYVGALAEQSGRMQAELAMELFGSDPENLNEFDRNADKRIQAVILKGEQGHQDAEIRTATVQRTFREKGYELDVLVTEVANWDRNESYEKMSHILDDLDTPLELVLSNNDAMAIGAISIMRQREYFKDDNANGMVDKYDSSWVPVLGIDGVPDAVSQIEDGYLYGTVLNDYNAIAEAIVELSAYLVASGDDGVLGVTQGRYIWIDYKTFRLD